MNPETYNTFDWAATHLAERITFIFPNVKRKKQGARISATNRKQKGGQGQKTIVNGVDVQICLDISLSKNGRHYLNPSKTKSSSRKWPIKPKVSMQLMERLIERTPVNSLCHP
jgi:hypothetical protein